jgi:hypothetical protein
MSGRRKARCGVTTPWAFGITGFSVLGAGLLIALIVTSVVRNSDICPNSCATGEIHMPNCTCYAGVYTVSYNYSIKAEPQCKNGTEYYQAACFDSCPIGFTRTQICSCTQDNPRQTITDCVKYGNRRPWGSAEGPFCRATEEEFKNQCYVNKCPSARLSAKECLTAA